MKKQRRIRAIKNKRKQQIKLRSPIAPPTIRHGASKGTGYNRLKDKRKFMQELKEIRDV